MADRKQILIADDEPNIVISLEFLMRDGSRSMISPTFIDHRYSEIFRQFVKET